MFRAIRKEGFAFRIEKAFLKNVNQALGCPSNVSANLFANPRQLRVAQRAGDRLDGYRLSRLAYVLDHSLAV